MPEPLDRVRAYVESMREVNPSVTDADESDGNVLTITDLRDVLTELDECYALLASIDTVLDEPTSFARLERIRVLLGNHRGKDV